MSEERDMTLFDVPHMSRFIFRADPERVEYHKVPSSNKTILAGDSSYSTLDGGADVDLYMHQAATVQVHVTNFRGLE